MRLSKDADALICLMYKHFLEQRSNNISKQQARYLGHIEEIHSLLQGLCSIDDTVETCKELHSAGLITCEFNDNTVFEAFFNDNGIIYMENRFKDGVNEVLKYIKSLKDTFSI